MDELDDMLNNETDLCRVCQQIVHVLSFYINFQTHISLPILISDL